MSRSLSALVDNLSEIDSKKCRDKNCKSACDSKGAKITNLLIIAKECTKKRLKPINGLIKRFPNTGQFCNNDISLFCYNDISLFCY